MNIQLAILYILVKTIGKCSYRTCHIIGELIGNFAIHEETSY